MTAKERTRFQRVEALFESSLKYPPGPERDGYLEREAATDRELVEEVRHLLKEDERVSASVLLPPEALPSFGSWQAIRLLGRGGMGVVYLAERADGAFRMTAAVKVVPLALASQEIEERFRRERQFLASLDHPRIARLVDGGVSSAGLPYLVMEYVDGLPIDLYCEREKLDERGRIGLMRQVLETLIYVHERQVIHRDLKSSNILVDAAGNAKVLDFGTARLVDASGDNAITKTGVFAFTPECASPEQVQGKQVTFASDIYSAGVLLYRLLTGRPPYMLPTDADEIADSIGLTPPEPSGLNEQLDAILAKALRKKAEERYQSAADLDADLARYLEGNRVRARLPRKTRAFSWAAAWAAGLVLVCALAAWYAMHAARGGAAAGEPQSIAVLPFEMQGSGAQDEYLAAGLTDDITEMLSRVKNLRVIGRSSTALTAARFHGTSRDPRKAGQMLNVANLLEGKVELIGDQVRITAQVASATGGPAVWSAVYSRPLQELMDVQSEIAEGVTRSLTHGPSPAVKHVPPPEAHEYVLKGRYESQSMTVEAIKQAESDFQRGIDLDPEYAAAYAALGAAKLNEMVARGSTYQTLDERKTAEQLIQKAIALDPGLSSAHGDLAAILMQYEWDWQGAEREARQGASGGEKCRTCEQAYAFLAIFHGRFAEADRHIAAMQDLDPFSSATMYNVGVMRFLEGRVDDSRAMMLKAIALYPKILSAQGMIVLSDIQAGRTDLALREIHDFRKSGFPMMEAMALARAGRREEALRLLRPFEEKYPDPGAALEWFALAYAYMGDEANTVKWLTRSVDRHEWQSLNLAVHPAYVRMRNLPAFRALERRMGLLADK